MHPYLPAHIPAYPVLLVLSVVVSLLVGVYGLWRAGIAMQDSLRLQLATTVAGLLGAKLYSLIERSGGISALQSELTQGYRYPGAILGLAVVLALVRRWVTRGVSLAAIGDALAPSVGVGVAILRIGCFLYGCCFGTASSLPWAMSFPASSPSWSAHLTAGWIGPHAAASLAVHPLQLYFALLSLTAAAVAVWLQNRKRFDGQVLFAFLAIDQLGKYGLEFLRHDALPHVQLAGLGIGLLAAGTLLAVPLVRDVRTSRRGLSDPPVSPWQGGNSDTELI